jgi:hypothetical protein
MLEATQTEKVSSRDYIIFPVAMLPEIFSDRQQAINNMLDYGAGYKAQSSNIDFSKALSLTLYDHLNGKETPNLIEFFVESSHIYRCDVFDIDGLFNESLIFEAWNEFAVNIYSEDITAEKEEIMAYGKMRDALKYLKMKQDVGTALRRFAKLERPGKEVFVMMKSDTVISYRNEMKTDFELVLFCVYASIRSIIGSKHLAVKTNIEFVLKRAFGNNEELIKKYSTRRMYTKIMEELELNWGLKKYSYHTKGFYVSTKMSLQELIYFVEQKKSKNRLEKLKKEKAELRTAALLMIAAEKGIAKISDQRSVN